MATNLQIYIDGQLADYEESEAFPLVFSERGVNISNVTEKAGNASFTVEFPLTDNNKKIFKHKENLTVSNKFNVTKDTQSEVYIGDSLVFQGAFRILQITANKLQGFFMVSDAVWFNDLAGKSMRDLKIKEIAFTGHSASGLNMEYVMETKTRADYPAEHPLVCYGGFYNSGENGLNLQNILTSDFMNFQDLPPHLYLKEVIQKMFTDVNWQVTGDILNPDRDNWIISKAGKDESFWNWNVLGRNDFYINNFQLYFQIDTGANLTTNGDFVKAYKVDIINSPNPSCNLKSYFQIGCLKNITSFVYDVETNKGLNMVNSVWHTPIDAYWFFESNYTINTIKTATGERACFTNDVDFPVEYYMNQYCIYFAMKNWTGTNEELLDLLYNTVIQYDGTPANVTYPAEMVHFVTNLFPTFAFPDTTWQRSDEDIDLVFGDVITYHCVYFHSGIFQTASTETYGIEIDKNSSNGSTIYPAFTESQNCILNYDTNEYVPAYSTLEIGRSLPNLSQQDFIRGLMNMFNLYTNVDLDRRIIDFKTGESFYKNGYYYNDITEFCDIRSYEITPKGMPKTFELNYINDEADRNDDNLDIKTKQTNKTVYAEKENIIQLPFSLTKIGRFQDFLSTDYFNAPFIYNPDFTNQSLWSTAFNYQPRFFNYLGTSNIYSAFRAGAYQPPILLCDIPNIGSSVLYSTYYAPLFGDYDTKEAVEIMVLIDIEKYKRLRLDIPVMIDGVLYNIEAKENFAPLKNGLTKIKLIRK